MELQQRQACPLCLGEKIDRLRPETIAAGQLRPEDFRITDSRYGLRWNLSVCANCELIFANPVLSENDIVAFYAALSDGEYGQEERGRGRNFSTILKRIGRFELPNRRLLDIGAANGLLVHLSRQAGYEAHGIEPAAELVLEAQERFDIDLFQGTLADFPQQGKYAVITMIDVLEHLVNPAAFLTQATERLEAGGLLVIVTPDSGSLASRIMGGRWWHFRIAHLCFFNRRSLVFLLEKHGLTAILWKRYAWHFSLHYLLTRLLPALPERPALQKLLKKINLPLPLLDSWEVYARKSKH